jgi:hypothetical protein
VACSPCQLFFRPVPHLVGASACLRPIGEGHFVGGKTKLAVDLRQQADKSSHFARYVLLAAEHMSVVLFEGAGSHQSVQSPRRLVAMTHAELCIAERKVAPGPQSSVEDLDMTRARHRLERHRAIAVGQAEHVLAELLPVAALNPQLVRHEHGGLHLSVAEAAHLLANVVLEQPIDRVAAWMPKHHPRRVFLDVPEIEPGSEAAVIEIVHVPCSCDLRARRGRNLSVKRRPRPLPAGPFLVVAACLYRV